MTKRPFQDSTYQTKPKSKLKGCSAILFETIQQWPVNTKNQTPKQITSNA